MARPRVFVNREAKPVKTDTGVSYHRASRRFYTISRAGGRAYFKTWDDARAALAIAEASNGQPIALEIDEPDDPFSGPPADELPPAGTPLDEIDDDHPHKLRLIDDALGTPRRQIVEIPGDVFWREAKRQLERDPDGFIERIGLRRFFDPRVVQKGDGPKLSKVGAAWQEHQVAKHASETRHITDTLGHWQRFVKATGDCRTDVLRPEHFRAYFDAVHQAAKGKSAKWYLDRCKVPKSILNWAKRRYPEYGITSDALDWADGYDRRTYKPARNNRTPITPAAFSALVNAAREWQRTDPATIDVSTNRGRGLKRQAHARRREGWLLEAALRLALNCALDCVDLERIEWSHLHLESEPPFMDFPRRKTEARVGQPTPRITPLLPTTVEALRRWQQIAGYDQGPVFRSFTGGAYDRSRSSRAFQRLKSAAKLSEKVSLKSLRNAAPTVAFRQLRSRDLADLILGHEIGSVARHYIGDVDDPCLLLELVNRVGQEYDA
ncbi:MAG: hypothetical protein H6816_02500 [Phycisphaerales bacterium]|nr:hypothetical protein [Phycisphaerales bacterium]